MGRLDGKVAFVTGTARGQGRSHAVRLVQEGADVIALDLCAQVPGSPHPGATTADLEETVRLVEALDRRIVAEPGDVRESADLERVLAAGVSHFGRLDVVVANAGITVEPHSADEISEESWDPTIAINLSGV
jgi:(+)-trans-carveol dehydrogenase